MLYALKTGLAWSSYQDKSNTKPADQSGAGSALDLIRARVEGMTRRWAKGRVCHFLKKKSETERSSAERALQYGQRCKTEISRKYYKIKQLIFFCWFLFLRVSPVRSLEQAVYPCVWTEFWPCFLHTFRLLNCKIWTWNLIFSERYGWCTGSHVPQAGCSIRLADDQMEGSQVV